MAFLVLTGGQAARETDRLAVALLGQSIHVGAARVGQAEETPDLIESLACGIVQGTAQLHDVGRYIADLQDVRVPA